jgi:hypothetical protein
MKAAESGDELNLGLPTAPAGILLALLLDPKDGGDSFLRNLGPSPKKHGVTSQKIINFQDKC